MPRPHRLWSAIVAAATCVALVASLAACGNSDDSDASKGGGGGGSSDPVHIAFFSESIANTYTKETQRAIETIAKERNATVDVFDGAFDARKQFAQVQDAISSGKFDAFLSVPIDATGLAPAMQAAIKKGIKVGNISFPLGPDLASTEPQLEGQSVAVLDPAALRGKWLGELTTDACGSASPCKVVYLAGAAATPQDKAARQGFDEATASSDVKVVAQGDGGYLSNVSLKAMQNILQAHPDIDVVATVGDQMANGAALALKAKGISYGVGESDVKIIGLGASKLALDAISKGDWFGTVVSLPYTEGELAAKAVIDAARGKLAHPLGVSAVEQAGQDPHGTKETLADFEPQWQG
jgi:ribose transport system substrate-binding protein